jgi:hypothetical protein
VLFRIRALKIGKINGEARAEHGDLAEKRREVGTSNQRAQQAPEWFDLSEEVFKVKSVV